MNEIIIKTQSDLDKLPKTFTEYTVLKIESTKLIYVKSSWENSNVVAYGNSHVEARENSHVEARENSHVEAWGNSHVIAWGNSHVEARENSHVEARENSHVEAYENSHVEACGNSNVVACGNSNVVARENSNVVACGNSNVEARGNVGVHSESDSVTVNLFMFAVCWKHAKGKIFKKSKTSTIIIPKDKGFFENNGIKKSKNVIVFKRVSKDFKTQEDTINETVWNVGSILEHKNWNPEKNECGEGKFHACSKPYFCDEFRFKKDDRYIAIQVNLEDFYEWKNPSYPHKVAFRKGKVLYEVNKFGEKIS